jgi:hypothetical protein
LPQSGKAGPWGPWPQMMVGSCWVIFIQHYPTLDITEWILSNMLGDSLNVRFIIPSLEDFSKNSNWLHVLGKRGKQVSGHVRFWTRKVVFWMQREAFRTLGRSPLMQRPIQRFDGRHMISHYRFQLLYPSKNCSLKVWGVKWCKTIEPPYRLVAHRSDVVEKTGQWPFGWHLVVRELDFNMWRAGQTTQR